MAYLSILDCKTVKNGQIDPQTAEIRPKQLIVELSVSDTQVERGAEILKSKYFSLLQKQLSKSAFFS